MLSILEKVKGYWEAVAILEEKQETNRQILGGWYNGLSTDFERLTEALEQFEIIWNNYQGRIPDVIFQNIGPKPPAFSR